MTSETYLAIDLGAESGRAILGRLDDERLTLEEVHRFPNGPVQVPVRGQEHIQWDVLRQWSDVQMGIRAGANAAGPGLRSLGVDTWGVDYGLLDGAGRLLGNPYHYRDARMDGMVEAACAIVPAEEIYRQTGIQFMQLNTLYQLFAMRHYRDPLLDIAQAMLNMPDLFNFWLSGALVSEFTIATTTQCYNPVQDNWAWDLLQRLEIPARIFQPILQPACLLGSLRPALASALGTGDVQVVTVGGHDTASAVAAVPAETDHFAFISSGTWSLIGSEIPAPVINEESRAFNFTNEGGVGGTFRFLKNLSGMWLVQECRREWAGQGQPFSYDQLTNLAAQAEPFRSLVNPGAETFLHPGGMPERIRAYCRRTGQPAPETVGAFVRCALESLALAYRQALGQIEQVLGYPLEAVHIVGGGSRNRLLNQFTADACGKPVIAGPVEATATGNLLVQAMALGRLASLADVRQVVRTSFHPDVFQPGNSQPWDSAYARWLKLQEQGK